MTESMMKHAIPSNSERNYVSIKMALDHFYELYHEESKAGINLDL